MSKYKIAIAKAVLRLFWILGYGLCFAIAYGYNAYFRDNSYIVQNAQKETLINITDMKVELANRE